VGKTVRSPTREDVARELARPAAKDHPTCSADVEPNWSMKCITCGATPVMPITGLCGPCTFGEAETMGGNW